MLKCQFHSHAAGDPADYIPYTAQELINEAKKLNYDVLAITCHRKMLFTEEIDAYAEQQGILLLPGCEFEINGKHILGINIDADIEKVDTYEKLAAYKKSHPNCLIIAAHPFFPGSVTLKQELINNIDHFDAIEHSFAYNHKALKTAQKYNKPFVATADCHSLKDLDLGYILVDSPKERNSLIAAIKANKIQSKTKPFSYFRIVRFLIKQGLRNLFNKNLQK